MTNREWINQFNDEDFAQLDLCAYITRGAHYCTTHHCDDCKLQWLKEEHKESEEE